MAPANPLSTAVFPRVDMEFNLSQVWMDYYTREDIMIAKMRLP